MTEARASRVRLLGVAVAAGVAVVFACLSVRATAAPAPFLLTFDGAHSVDPLCPTGSATTVASPRPRRSAPQDGPTTWVTPQMRGDFLTSCASTRATTAAAASRRIMPTVRGEHGGTGSWRILEGTGRYATLRGLGTYTGTLISGDPDVFATISYRTNWQGVVDFDADPPTIETFTTTPRKLRLRLRTYALQVGLAARDPSAPVSYTVDVRAGRAPLAFKQGSTASGQATITLQIRPPRAARSVEYFAHCQGRSRKRDQRVADGHTAIADLATARLVRGLPAAVPSTRAG